LFNATVKLLEASTATQWL